MVRFEVTVEEALTGRSQNVSANVLLHKYKYKMELFKTSEYFKPGLKYSAFVSLLHNILYVTVYNYLINLSVSDQVESPRRYSGVRRQKSG